jgi:hypothetical protein
MAILKDLKDKLVEIEEEIEAAITDTEAEVAPVVEAEVAPVVEEVKKHVNPIIQMALDQAAARLARETAK